MGPNIETLPHGRLAGLLSWSRSGPSRARKLTPSEGQRFWITEGWTGSNESGTSTGARPGISSTRLLARPAPGSIGGGGSFRAISRLRNPHHDALSSSPPFRLVAVLPGLYNLHSM